MRTLVFLAALLPGPLLAQTVDDVFDAFGYADDAAVTALVPTLVAELPRNMLCGARMTDAACDATIDALPAAVIGDRPALDAAIKARIAAQFSGPDALAAAMKVVRETPEAFSAPPCNELPSMDGRCILLFDGMFDHLPMALVTAQDAAKSRVSLWFRD